MPTLSLNLLRTTLTYAIPACKLLDQGYHLIDLVRRFLGKFADVRAKLRTFWSADVEDNPFVTLRVFLHATWTEWKTCSHLRFKDT
jgi:predicted dehydrogenase